jgi:integrase
LAHKNPLQNRTDRLKLEPQNGKPHWSVIGKVHLGYRRIESKAGTWCTRRYRVKDGKRGYEVERIGVADDLGSAGGALSFTQALKVAEERADNFATNGTSDYTVAKAVDDYLRHLEDLGKKSVRDMRYRADCFIIGHDIGKLKTAAFNDDTNAAIKSWLRNLAKERARARGKNGKGPNYRAAPATEDQKRQRRSSANKVWAILRAALNFAHEEGKIASNIGWSRIKKFEGVDVARVRYLETKEEAQRLITAASEEFRPVVRCALETGLRYGEITRLKVRDFADNRGAIQVLVSKSGKARDVILSDDAIEFFRAHCKGRDRDEFMFRHENGEPWKKAHQQKPMKAAIEKAGIEPICFHEIRHTYASHAAMAGMPLTVLARQLGHTSTRMVEKHYGHLAEDYIAREARKFAPSFGMTHRA